MKSITTLLAFTFLLFGNLSGQDITTVEAANGDISDNLDLEAVASLFGDCEDLEEFERRLNDPESRISNLDLNENGYVDYLRVVENAESDYHLITIQAVIGKDLYQDVATIDVELDQSSNETRVQIVGDVYMYGPNYIIEPVYVSRPRIFINFWRPRYVCWVSPWYWDYYPSYWSWWAPYPVYAYINYIPVHIHHHHVYHRRTVRRSAGCARIHRTTRRNDVEISRPGTTFKDRNKGVLNREDLVQQRESGKIEKPRPVKEVSRDWQTEAEKQGRDSKVKDNQVKVPQDRPVSQGKDVERPKDKAPDVTRDRPAKEQKTKSQSDRKPKTSTSSKTPKTPKTPKKPKTSKSSKSSKGSKTSKSSKSSKSSKTSKSSRSTSSSKSKKSSSSRSSKPPKAKAPSSKSSGGKSSRSSGGGNSTSRSGSGSSPRGGRK